MWLRLTHAYWRPGPFTYSVDHFSFVAKAVQGEPSKELLLLPSVRELGVTYEDIVLNLSSIVSRHRGVLFRITEPSSEQHESVQDRIREAATCSKARHIIPISSIFSNASACLMAQTA